MNWYQPYGYFPQTVSSQHVFTPTKAIAEIQGGPLAPNLHGYIAFLDVPYGTEVFVEVSGLPAYRPASGDHPPIGPFGFHLHDNSSCAVGDPQDPFQSAGSHWNPTDQPHGNHAGDFPPLFSNDGYARMSFFTNKFRVADVIGRTVIIHQNPDDFRTQPAGNSGKRLACGLIQAAG
ncbi:superoxide dismutase family protein [Brevibacillus centrosporus]|uniref:superoxide dismutase family protein n=1 Tax=Brevibacillus centrosporus TaxID=54910 RepID=UPI0038064822